MAVSNIYTVIKANLSINYVPLKYKNDELTKSYTMSWYSWGA